MAHFVLHSSFFCVKLLKSMKKLLNDRKGWMNNHPFFHPSKYF